MAGLERFELPTAGFEDQNSSAELQAADTDYWYGWRDSNPQDSDFKSDMYTNSITSACGALGWNRTIYSFLPRMCYAI